MREARRFPGICVLPDGSLVVTGGQSSKGQPLKSAERFFPTHGANGRWSPLPDLTTGRYAHASTLLPDGRVGVFASHTRSRACEAFDVDEGQWSPLPSLTHGRAHVAAVTVGDQVFVIGGSKDGTAGDEMLVRNPDGPDYWESLTLRPSDQEGRGQPGKGTPLRECGGAALVHIIDDSD